MLRYAYTHSPYYRKAFEAIGITSDNIAETPLNRFPTLNKELLMTRFDELVTDQSLKQKDILHFCEDQADGSQTYLGKYHIVHSSGSTGTPRYLDTDLATNAGRPSGIKTGDIMLYGNSCLVLFYESFSTSYGYTSIGHIDDPAGLAAALGSGSVQMTFRKG